MAWCEHNHVGYVFGLARNKRLQKIVGAQMYQARILHQRTGKAARVFTEFGYRTKKSWSCARRVVAKAGVPGKRSLLAGVEGGVPRQGRKPALHRYFTLYRTMARAGPV